MRPLVQLSAAVLLAALVVSSAPAADEERQAKEAAVAFLKAAKAKDVDTMLKYATVPYTSQSMGRPKVCEKESELKGEFTRWVGSLKDTSKLSTDVLHVLTLQEAMKAAGLKEGDKDYQRTARVLGKDGLVVVMGKADMPGPLVLVAFKEGRAKVVGMPK
jgi:hypothetical protein